MPHFVLEYSANLEADIDVDGLLRALHEAAVATELFPLGGIRFRAHPCRHYLIADGHPDNAFVHLTAMVGAGRDLADRQRAGERLFGALTAALEGPARNRPLPLSFEMRELEPALNYKQNNIHDYVKARAGGGA